MTLINKNVIKYLTNYAETETRLLNTFPIDKICAHVVIIPAYKESITFIERFFTSALALQNVLVIAVINQPDNDKNHTPQEDLYQQSLALGSVCWQNHNLTLLCIDETNSLLLLVDRYTVAIPENQGVGLARKIGADIALKLMSLNLITSRWLYSSDADAHLPNNYFSSLQHVDHNCVVSCFNFDHKSDNLAVHQANQLYQTALQYYVAGLYYAGSSYTFYTIGSVLAFDGSAYAMARGFPKRSAGEDFYLINKLAKLGEVQFIVDCKILIEARTSDRVPFGTGPAVSKILALQNQGKPYCYYNPHLFELLKQTLSQFSTLWQYRQNFEKWLEIVPKEVSASLIKIGLSNFVAKQANEKKSQFDKQLNVWFDAFKTLKFIHVLREQGYRDMPLSDAIAQAKFNLIN